MKLSSKTVALGLAAMLIAGCSGFGKKGAPGAPPAPPSQRPAVAGTRPAVPDKGDPQARFAAAVQMMKEKKLQDAEAALIALNTDFPQYSGPMTNLGILYAKTNRRDQAISALTRAATLNGKNAVAWNWLGIEQRDAGDRAAAEQAYLRALAAKPDYALAHLNLGILYDAYIGRPADALVHYKQYQQLAGKDELRVAAWIAEIESKPGLSKSTPPVQQPAAPAPTATQTKEGPKGSLLPVRKQ
jgi:tetratricopeptide (TPR) repeat protein